MACVRTFFKFEHKTRIIETYPMAPLARFFFSLSFCRAGFFFWKLLNPSLTENNGPCLTFFSSETWTDFESESDVSWEIWNEIETETEIAAAEEKGNENVSVGVIWTETLI